MRVESYNKYADEHGSAITGELPDFEGILIEFPHELADWEREQVRGAACYWSFKPYVAAGSEVSEWLTKRHFWIDASTYRSRSSDWRKHDILGELEETLVEGSYERKDGTRKWQGVGVAPERVVLGHPGDKPPKTPRKDEPLGEGRQGPLFGLESPHDLFKMPMR